MDLKMALESTLEAIISVTNLSRASKELALYQSLIRRCYWNLEVSCETYKRIQGLSHYQIGISGLLWQVLVVVIIFCYLSPPFLTLQLLICLNLGQ